MVSRRVVRIAAPSLGIVAAAAAIALVAATSAGRTQAGWVSNHDLAPGTVIAAQDVRAVQVPVGGDTFSVAPGSPVGERTTHGISSGDLIRPDDVSAYVMVDVPVSLKITPPLTPGAAIDIYATAGSGGGASQGAGPVSTSAGPTAVLVARGVTVVGAGSPVVIAVPAEQEPLWVALASSQTELIAVLSTGVNVPSGGIGYQGSQAVQILAQLAQRGGVPAPAATASPMPTPGSP